MPASLATTPPAATDVETSMVVPPEAETIVEPTDPPDIRSGDRLPPSCQPPRTKNHASGPAETCVFYCRTASAAADDTGIRSQLERCRAYARRHDLAVIAGRHVFEDRGRAGFGFEARAGLSALLDAARARRFGKLLVTSLCRLSRDLPEALAIIRMFRVLGVAVHLIDQDQGQVSEAELALRSIIGPQQRELFRQRAVVGRRRTVIAGRSVGRAPYGYRSEGGRIAIDPVEAEVVRTIFDMFDRGVPAARIARTLNDRGDPSPAGGRWSSTAILGRAADGSGLLRRSSYAGFYVDGRTRIEIRGGRRIRTMRPREHWFFADQPERQIVCRELWTRVCRRLAADGGTRSDR